MSRYSYSYFYENYYSPIYDINYFVNFKLAILNDSINLNNVKKKKKEISRNQFVKSMSVFHLKWKKEKKKQTNKRKIKIYSSRLFLLYLSRCI